MNTIEESIFNFDKRVSEIQELALAGSKPSEILRYLAIDCRVEGKAQLMVLFVRAFSVGLKDVSSICGWWYKGTPDLNDKKIDVFLKPVLDRYSDGAMG